MNWKKKKTEQYTKPKYVLTFAVLVLFQYSSVSFFSEVGVESSVRSKYKNGLDSSVFSARIPLLCTLLIMTKTYIFTIKNEPKIEKST